MKNHYHFSLKIILFIRFFMISEQGLKMAIHDKLKLTLQSFHQCSSLVSIKLTSTNFLLWKSQVLPLIRSLGILDHHIFIDEKPDEQLIDEGRKSENSQFLVWTNNDGLLMPRLLGNMIEEVLSMVIGADIALSV